MEGITSRSRGDLGKSPSRGVRRSKRTSESPIRSVISGKKAAKSAVRVTISSKKASESPVRGVISSKKAAKSAMGGSIRCPNRDLVASFDEKIAWSRAWRASLAGPRAIWAGFYR